MRQSIDEDHVVDGAMLHCRDRPGDVRANLDLWSHCPLCGAKLESEQ